MRERIAGNTAAEGDVANLSATPASMLPVHSFWNWSDADRRNKLAQFAPV